MCAVRRFTPPDDTSRPQILLRSSKHLVGIMRRSSKTQRKSSTQPGRKTTPPSDKTQRAHCQIPARTEHARKISPRLGASRGGCVNKSSCFCRCFCLSVSPSCSRCAAGASEGCTGTEIPLIRRLPLESLLLGMKPWVPTRRAGTAHGGDGAP